LLSGDEKIATLLRGSAQDYADKHTLIRAESDHPFVYRIVTGWACRIRSLPDGRDQCILVFLPGDLFAVKSMFVTRHPDAIRVLCPSVIECIEQRKLM
jgi:CRP-like cAMP-binding protein